MSSNSPAGAPLELSRPLIVVAAPVVFVVFGLFVPTARALGEPVGAQLLFSLLFGVVGAAVYLAERRFHRTRVSGAAVRIREFVVLVFAVALIEWGLLGTMPSLLLARPLFWIGEVAALIVFAFVTGLQSQLGRREFFFGAVRRAVKSHTGEAAQGGIVMAAARDFGIEAGEAEDGMRRVRRWLIFFVVWFIGLLVVTAWVLRIAGEGEQLLIAGSSAVVIAAIIALGRMGEEHDLVMSGLLPSPRGSSLGLFILAPLFLLSAALALVLATRPAPISDATLAAIGAWIAWLFSLIPSPKRHSAPPPPSHHPAAPIRPPSFAQLHKLPQAHTSQLLHTILVYAGWTILALLVAGFIWLLISPLFRMQYRRGSLARSLRNAIRGLLASFRRALARLREATASVGGLRGEERPAALDRADDERGEPRRRRRRGGLFGALFGGPNRRFARAFLRLAKWGEQRGVPFSRSTGPREYVELVGERLPELRGELSEIALLFERHLFSPRPLTAEQMADYYSKISEVTHRG